MGLKTSASPLMQYRRPPRSAVPPDFACGRIAFEVRRLNQHDGSGRGLEVTSFPLVMNFRNLLAALGPPSNTSWFATFQYQRPLEKWRSLRPKIEKALIRFRDNPADDVASIPVTDTFSLGIARASNLFDMCFVHGGQTDQNAGGWIASEIIRNLTIAIAEKSKKIEPVHSKYAAWWLIWLTSCYVHLGPNEVRAAIGACCGRPADENISPDSAAPRID
jgi:hypothetical protein